MVTATVPFAATRLTPNGFANPNYF